MSTEKYLPLEHPDAAGVVDFISELTVVRAEIVVENGDRFLLLNVKASEHEEASWWAEQDFKVRLPQRIKDDEGE